MSQAQTLREQRAARTIDREIAPVWHDRFARMIWRNLPRISGAMALDVHSGTGRTTAELLDRLDDASRVVALEPSDAMRNLAKTRVHPAWKPRVYLKPGDITAVAEMGEHLYDLVVANMILGEAHDMRDALGGLIRVTKPGGTILATLPMAGTWSEAEDLFREVLRDAGLKDSVRRLRRLVRLRPSGQEIADVVGPLGIDSRHFVVEQERFELLFRSGREFLFSPLVEYGPLPLWKAIVGSEGNPQQLFWQLKESIDTYFSGHVFGVTVVAGVLRLSIPERGEVRSPLESYWRRYPALDALWRREEQSVASPYPSEEMDIDIDFDSEEASVDTEETTVERPIPQLTRDDDDAIFAAMDRPKTGAHAGVELDVLLDKVLEFDSHHPEESVNDDPSSSQIRLRPSKTKAKKPASQVKTLQRLQAVMTPPPTPKPGGRNDS